MKFVSQILAGKSNQDFVDSYLSPVSLLEEIF